MVELTFYAEQKEFNNAREHLTTVKVDVCMKALEAIGALPIGKEEINRLEQALYEAFAWI